MAQEQPGFPHYPLQKNGGLSCLSENFRSSARLPTAGTDRAALHIWASRPSHRLFQPSPNGWIVVASVYSLASQWRVG
jgi:hypothetical protein